MNSITLGADCFPFAEGPEGEHRYDSHTSGAQKNGQERDESNGGSAEPGEGCEGMSDRSARPGSDEDGDEGQQSGEHRWKR